MVAVLCRPYRGGPAMSGIVSEMVTPGHGARDFLRVNPDAKAGVDCLLDWLIVVFKAKGQGQGHALQNLSCASN